MDGLLWFDAPRTCDRFLGARARKSRADYLGVPAGADARNDSVPVTVSQMTEASGA